MAWTLDQNDVFSKAGLASVVDLGAGKAAALFMVSGMVVGFFMDACCGSFDNDGFGGCIFDILKTLFRPLACEGEGGDGGSKSCWAIS